MAEEVELVARLVVDHKLAAASDEMLDHRSVVRLRRPLVEGDLVDSPRVLVLGEQTDQRFADGPGADHVHDVLRCHKRARILAATA